MQERINKLIAASGIASRRDAENLIREGRVTLNGQIVKDLGQKADPEKDDLRLDGERIGGKPTRLHYLILNKPLNCMTTMHDEEGRLCVGDLLRKADARLFPAGRLDWDSEGLLILTNDGEFANRITHPRYEVPKIYLAKVEGHPTELRLNKLRRGVTLEDGPTLPAKVELHRKGKQHDWLRITLTEGRNRIVRRMCQRIRHDVIKLKRIGVGPLRLGDLKPGESRVFTPAELAMVEALKAGRPVDALPASMAKSRPAPKSRKGFAKAKPKPVKPGYKQKKRAAKKTTKKAGARKGTKSSARSPMGKGPKRSPGGTGSGPRTPGARGPARKKSRKPR